MELDELKYQIKNRLAADHAGRTEADIAALLQKRTQSVAGKLKRSLLFEILFSVLIVICFGYIGLTAKLESFKIYFSVFTIICIGLLLVLIYLLRRVTKLCGTTMPVKSNLVTLVTMMEEFTRRYFQLTMALIPVCFVFILVLIRNDPNAGNAGNHYLRNHLTTWQIWALAIAYVLLLSVAAYYFTKGYLRKLYGRYVAQLKECIGELNDK